MIPFGHNMSGSYESTDTTGSVVLNWWFSTEGDSTPLFPGGRLTMFGSIFDHHNWRRGAPGTERVGARDAAQHPAVPRV